MLDLAEMDTFPNLEQQVDGAQMVAKAKSAVAELRSWTKKQRETIREQEAHAATIAADAKKAQDDGKIIEDGSHQELIAHGGVYVKLWAHQSGGFIEE